MKSEFGKVFGAFTDISWASNAKISSKHGNGNSFVFSLRDDCNFVKLKCLSKWSEVYHHYNALTCIGFNGSGFWIYNNCRNTNSFSMLGYKG